VSVIKSTAAPLLLLALHSPKGTYDNVFLANYANINLVDQLTRVPGINALTLSPALCALLLRPRKPARGSAREIFHLVQPCLRTDH